MRKNGWYERKLYGIDSSRVSAYTVRVPGFAYQDVENGDVKFKSSIPDICMPGSSFTVIFVLYAMRDKPLTTTTNEDTCHKYGISISTLRRWTKILHHKASEWNSLLNRYISTAAFCSDRERCFWEKPAIPHFQDPALSAIQMESEDLNTPP